jgi:hypothetical protein
MADKETVKKEILETLKREGITSVDELAEEVAKRVAAEHSPTPKPMKYFWDITHSYM